MGSASRGQIRFKLTKFEQIEMGHAPAYLVRDVLPRRGIGLIWGAPKSRKTFFALDLVLHVALGREYCGKRVQQSGCLYLAFEGNDGIARRIEAFKRQRLNGRPIDVPFWLMSGAMTLVADLDQLIDDIREQLGINRRRHRSRHAQSLDQRLGELGRGHGQLH